MIPAGYTLDRVHDAIQVTMGWQDSHLHMFRIVGLEYGPAYLDDELEVLDEKQFRIGDLVKAGDVAGYEYDFGDGWEHELVVEASDVADAATVYPGCIGGEGACPPEDCGGPGGFAELKELLAGPPSPEREEMRVWAGEDYDPAHFDLGRAADILISAFSDVRTRSLISSSDFAGLENVDCLGQLPGFPGAAAELA